MSSSVIHVGSLAAVSSEMRFEDASLILSTRI